MTEDLAARLGTLGGGEVRRRPDGWWVEAPAGDVVAVARGMVGLGARLVTITGVALPEGETELIYHYAVGTATVSVRTETRRQAIASITPVTPAAGWIEREVADLYAVDFEGHPQRRRLVRPPALPAGFFRRPSGSPDGAAPAS